MDLWFVLLYIFTVNLSEASAELLGNAYARAHVLRLRFREPRSVFREKIMPEKTEIYDF